MRLPQTNLSDVSEIREGVAPNFAFPLSPPPKKISGENFDDYVQNHKCFICGERCHVLNYSFKGLICILCHWKYDIPIFNFILDYKLIKGVVCFRLKSRSDLSFKELHRYGNSFLNWRSIE